MLFPTHLAAAALLTRVRDLSPWWLIVGAAVPDVVDKPLAMAGFVDLFHSVGHSAVLVVAAIPLALSSRAGVAAAVGWSSHLVLDALHVVSNGRPADALFLGWPLVVPPDPLELPPVPFVLQYVGTPSFLLEVLLWAALTALLYRRWTSDEPVTSAAQK